MSIKRFHKPQESFPVAFRADRDEWVELIGQNPAVDVLRELGISPRTWSAILAGRSPPVPVAAYRLARYHRWGDLGEVLGSAWRDFRAVGDALICPGLKYPIPASELRALWVRLMQLARLEAETLEFLAACRGRGRGREEQASPRALRV